MSKITPLLDKDQGLIIGIELERNGTKAQNAGFSENLEEGEKLLPAIIGPATRLNAEGRVIIRKDLPLETHYRQADWHWKEWSGRWQTIDRWKIVDIPYKRYPRDFILPTSIELTISKRKIISPIFQFPVDEEMILNTINVFLEIFGECNILTDNLTELISTPKKVLKWLILPQGVMPWERVKKELEPALKKASSQERVVFKDRFRETESYKPDFHAIGLAGFAGYVVFGFQKKNLYICESMWHGNAIYVFQEDWRELLKKTKAEVLRGKLQKERIVHYREWKRKLRELVKGDSKKGL